MVYKVAGGLPNCQAFSGGHPGKHIGDYENAVYKHTYEERKGKSFELYREHLEKEKYDRKIWMARDPRDAAVLDPLAEHAGDATPKNIQHFIGRAKWDADEVRDDLHNYVVKQIGDPDGVLIVDETGFLKKGTKSAGVARQYSGRARPYISVGCHRRG